MAINFWDAFLNMWSMCIWNVNLLSKTIPKIFSQELFPICSSSIMMLLFTLELQIKWHLSGLAFIWLSLNHLKSVFEAFWDFNYNIFKSSTTKKGILSSAWLASSTSFIMKNKSHKKILNKRGPKIDPGGTPNKIYSHELNSEFIWV